MDLTKNVGKAERVASIVTGGALTAYGLALRSRSGIAISAAGSGLIARGLTGHCPVRAATQKDENIKDENIEAKKTALPDGVSSRAPIKEAAPGHGGILVTKSVTIDAPAEKLYEFWRDFSRLPTVMQHLESVEIIDDTHSKWTAKAPLGQTVSWQAHIERDNPNQLIAWRSAPDASVPNSGSVRFVPAVGGRGTQIKVTLEYKVPGGALGATVAKLMGEEPQLQIDEDLRRFKSLMEAGEIPTTKGQPSGQESE